VSRELIVQKVMMCHAVIVDKLALCRTGALPCAALPGIKTVVSLVVLHNPIRPIASGGQLIPGRR
jgi:hypothetical protein